MTTVPAQRPNITVLTPTPATEAPQHPRVFLSLGELHPSTLNARASRTESQIREMAHSLAAQGQLQPLIVRSRPKRQGGYEVIAGETRRRGAALLAIEGRWDRPLEAIVRDDLTDAQARAVSLVENLHRAAMHPMDTADAVSDMIATGLTEAEAASALCVRLEEVRSALFLAQRLHESVKTAYREGQLAQDEARAFTLGTVKEQKDALPSVLATVSKGGRVSPAMIRQHFSQGKLPASRAVFDMALYTARGGTLLRALWTDDSQGDGDDAGETVYCESRALFARLQLEAVTHKLEAIRAEGQRAELVAASSFNQYEYRRAEENDPEAVIYLIYDETTLELRVSPPALTRAQFQSREKAEERARKLEERASLERRAAQGDESARASLSRGNTRAERPPFSSAFLERLRQERTRSLHAAAYGTDGAFGLAVAILGLLRVGGVHLAPLVNAPSEGRDEAVRGRVLERWTGEPHLEPAAAHPWRREDFGPLGTGEPAALFGWLVEQPLDTLLGLLTDLVCDRVGDWNETRRFEPHPVAPLTAALARFLEIKPSGAWALEREWLERCSRDTVARWNESVGLHVRPGETRKVLIARLLEMKPRLLERGWCPVELGFDAPAVPVEAASSPRLDPAARPENDEAEETEGDDWSEAEDWDEAA